jgi:hypothetical protein
MNTLIISTKRDHDSINFGKNWDELKKLKMNQIQDLIKKYGITEIHDRKILKENLIYGIVIYQKMSQGGKQTKIELNIDGFSKTYFIETKNNLVLVRKAKIKKMDIKNSNNIELYIIYNYLFDGYKSHTKEFYVEKENDKTRFRTSDCICKDRSTLFDDMELCHKAMCFIESLHFYFKIRHLLCLFDNNNDIIKNICFVYFERTLRNVSDIRCHFQAELPGQNYHSF